jgi:hypothetical protein
MAVPSAPATSKRVELVPQSIAATAPVDRPADSSLTGL